MLLVPTPLILSYYSDLTMHGCADDRNRVGTKALPGSVFMASAMFAINIRDRFCPQYYKLNTRFDILSGCVLFQLSDKSSDTLKYFGSYGCPFYKATDPVLTALAIHLRTEFDWTKKRLQDGFVSYDFKSDKVFDLGEGIVLASTRARGVSVDPISATLPAVSVVY